MRRDQFEIGIEREYALYAWRDGVVSYLLANDRWLAAFDALAGDEWHRMRAHGWRVAAEYSKCLVEIASPPVQRAEWSALLDGFARLEQWLARAAASLGDGIECSAEYSVRTDRFVAWSGEPVTAYADLLLDGAHDNWLLGSPHDIPDCFVGSAPELLYAGFTSTNATLHPPVRDGRDLVAYFWRALHTARAIDIASPQRHPLMRKGRTPVLPDPDRSIRDALIRWGDPDTATLLDTLSPDDGEQRYRAMFSAPDIHGYSARPRVVDDTLLFELRCFHSGVPLANLAPLLDLQ